MIDLRARRAAKKDRPAGVQRPFARVRAQEREGVANVLDGFREGTTGDMSTVEAEQKAKAIQAFVTRKEDEEYQGVPKPPLKGAGLIQGTLEGTSVCYCIDPKTWKQFKKELHALFGSYKGGTGCC